MINGVSFVAANLGTAADSVLQSAQKGAPTTWRLVNAYSLALASREPAYHELLKSGGRNLPDGKPLALALGVLERPGAGFCQVRGPSLFLEVLDRGRTHGTSHFFLGTTPGDLERLTSMMSQRFPDLKIAGVLAPPFRRMSTAEIELQDDFIKSCKPDLVWVALGTPTQDFEAERILRATGISTLAVGAAFDFASGVKPQAPRWMKALMLEWLFRLASEPKRLWKRYFWGNPKFLQLVWQEARWRRRMASNA